MRKLYLLVAVALFTGWIQQASAQAGFFTGLNNTTINVPCGTSCSQVKVQVPHLKSSNEYSLVSIPYTPFTYVTPGGTTLSSLYSDDRYSPVQPLGFSFCFYGDTYNSAVVGSNGLITFDVAQANTQNSYRSEQPIPYSGGIPNSAGSVYYPPASIMAVFTDLDPTTGASPTDRKIESRVEGVAPFRRYIASYYHVGTFGANTCSRGTGGRPGTPTTFQIVLYEQTGLIDIFIETKLCQSTTAQNGKTILGIQNWQRNKAVAGVGRNATTGWTATNEGWRFVPSGAVSRYLRAELYDLAGTLVQTISSDTATTTPGLLDLNFNNVCFTGGSKQFVLKTFYTACPSGTPINSADTITIVRGNLTATATATAAGCAPNGTATITIPATAGPYTYSITGGGGAQAPVTGSNPSFTFTNLIAGTYTVTGANAAGCAASTTVTVPLNGSLQVQLTPAPPTCTGLSNGSVTVTPQNGLAPYQYSINNGPYQTSNMFGSLAPGTYAIAARDSSGCVVANQTTTIVPGVAVTATVTPVNVSCNGGNNGSITATLSANAVAPVQYSLDGITYQSGNSFTGLTAGTYALYFRDGAACGGAQTFTITQPAALTLTLTRTAALCNGGNGSINASGSGGTPPYRYSLDGITYQTGSTFAVPAGGYTVYVRDAAGCIKSEITTIAQPAPLTASAQTSNATCNGGADGTITGFASGGTTPYQYSINGTAFQPASAFNVVRGDYVLTVRDANGCTDTASAVVGLTNNLTIAVSLDTTICEGLSATLRVTTNATSVLWSQGATLDNATSFTPVAAPKDTTQYKVTATLGACTRADSLIVNVTPAPIPDAGPDNEICFGQDYTLQGSGGVGYEWSPVTYFNNGSSATDQSVDITPAQTTTYNLSVVDARGCRSLTPDAVTITVTPPIRVVAAPRDTVVARGDVFQLRATSPVVDYVWSPGFGLDDPTKQNPVATITADITYIVTAYTGAGCRGTDTVRIKVYNGPEIYVPTAFTPNGDGRNEWLLPFPVGIKELKYFRVYNRWGQLLFQTQTLSKGWDGKLGGLLQPMDTYVWVLEAVTRDGVTVRKRGTATLIR